jgi:hypothetical protein
MRFLAAFTIALAIGGCSVTQKKANSKFKGVKGDVVAAFALLQGAAKAGDESKICNQVLSTALAAQLGGRSHCKDAINNVLDDADPSTLSMSTKTVTLGPGSPPTTATATVKSGSGKDARTGTLMLVKQHGTWRIDSFG